MANWKLLRGQFCGSGTIAMSHLRQKKISWFLQNFYLKFPRRGNWYWHLLSWEKEIHILTQREIFWEQKMWNFFTPDEKIQFVTLLGLKIGHCPENVQKFQGWSLLSLKVGLSKNVVLCSLGIKIKLWVSKK